MSADNAVAILATRDRFRHEPCGTYTRLPPDTDVWRVAHIGNPESFETYRTEELHNLGWWMAQAFRSARTFLREDRAVEYARHLEREIGVVEHGILTFDARPMNFPDC